MPPNIVPDLAWYTEISHQKNLLPRCPFANVNRCPRFYQSLSLLGNAGSTSISPDEDKRLLSKWGKSDLWPVTMEQSSGISIYNETEYSFDNFCPEVSFERFGIFAEYLCRYADDIDINSAHNKLSKESVLPNDWRWSWANISPMHYSECPLYSLLNIPEPASGNRIGF